jgi:Holliday junction resolvasome RuvABC endonuclease subunit
MVDGKIVDHFSIDLAKQKPRRGLSLYTMHRNLVDWIDTASQRHPGQTRVFIEESFIARHDPRTAVHLAQTVGMLLSLPYYTDVIPIQTWKIATVGSGNATKDQVRGAIALRFPDTVSLFGKRQDLYDATGVAIGGRGLLLQRR